MLTDELLQLRLLILQDHPWYPRLLGKCVRLPAHEDQDVGCLWWCGARSRGGERGSDKAWYGSLWIGPDKRDTVRAHVAVATAHGLITDFRVPFLMNLDHTCRRSLCVEHSHLELVTREENQARKSWPDRPLTSLEEELIAYRHLQSRLPWWHPEKQIRGRGDYRC